MLSVVSGYLDPQCLGITKSVTKILSKTGEVK